MPRPAPERSARNVARPVFHEADVPVESPWALFCPWSRLEDATCVPPAARRCSSAAAAIGATAIARAAARSRPGKRNRSLSGVLLPAMLTRNNRPPVQSGGTRSDQSDGKQQQVAAA